MDMTTLGTILSGIGVLVSIAVWRWQERKKASTSGIRASIGNASHSNIAIVGDGNIVHAAPALASEPPAPKGLKVSSSFGFLTFDNPPHLSADQMLFIEAVNVGPRPIQVVFISMNIEGSGKQLAWIPPHSGPALPCVLQEAVSVKAWKPLRVIGLSLLRNGFTRPVRLRPFAQDSYDTKHYGAWIDCNPKEWAKEV